MSRNRHQFREFDNPRHRFNQWRIGCSSGISRPPEGERNSPALQAHFYARQIVGRNAHYVPPMD